MQLSQDGNNRSHHHVTAAARVACTLLLLSLAGCSLFAPHLERPEIGVVGVQMLKSDLWHQELKVRLHVHNPNDRELPIKRLTYALDLDGQQFAHGESYASFVVPPRGDADFDMSVAANLTSLLLKLLSQSGSQIAYHIRGNVALSSGLWRSIPFDDSGSFRWQ